MAAETRTTRYIFLDVVLEVLLRVPEAHIAPLRQVSPLWRYAIDSAFFRREHRRRRKPMLLVFSRNDYTSPDLLHLARVHLLCFDADEREPRCLLRLATVPAPPPLHERFPGLQAHDAPPDTLFRVEACFAGVVLLSYADALFACNPCTGRWSRLPPIHLHRGIVGLYTAPPPPGQATELRVLFSDGARGYSLLDVGSLVVTGLGMPILADSPTQLTMVLRAGLRQDHYDDPPLYLDGCLYWRPQEQEQAGIVVFDTIEEQFGWLSAPSVKIGGKSTTLNVQVLFQLGGRLGAATMDVSSLSLQLWVREDTLWLPRRRIPLPTEIIADHVHQIVGMTNPFRVFIVPRTLDILVQLPQAVLHTDHRGSTLGFHGQIIATPHLFQPSNDIDSFLTDSREDEDHDMFFSFSAGTKKP